jgi:hypothetical protein
MGKHPNLGELDYLFDKGTDFRLSDRLYQERTGAALPKEKSYIKHSSALAKWANEKGYYIEEVENVAKIEREIVFKKRDSRQNEEIKPKEGADNEK